MLVKLFGGRITIGKDITPAQARADDMMTVMNSRYGLDNQSRNRLNAYKNLVYDCVTLIGEQAAQYRPRIGRRNKQGILEDAGDHEFLRLLRNPTGNSEDQPESFSSFDLWEGIASYQELLGDAFIYVGLPQGGGSGRPRSLALLRPDKVGTSINDKTGRIEGYYIRQSNGDPIPLEINEVLRFPLFNPKTPYKGLGRVEAGSDYISTDETTAKYTNNFFANNAGLSGVLSIKSEMTKGGFKKFSKMWRERYEGVGNAGKIMIIRNSDASFQQVGLGLNEIDMSALRSMTVEDVAMLFKVPLPLLGKIPEGAGLGRANIEVLEYMFAKYKIEPMFRRYDAILQFAMKRYYGVTDLEVYHDSIIPEDKEFTLSMRDKGVDRWLTREEIRTKDGLEDKPGANQLFVPMANIPIDEASAEAPTSSTSSFKPITVKIVRRSGTAKKKDSSDEGKITAEKAEAFRLRLMRNQAKYERAYKKRLKPIITQQMAEALNNLEAHASGLRKDMPKPFDDGAYDELMTAQLTPVLVDLSKQQGSLALVFAGDTENEFKMTAKIEDFVRKNTARMAKNFNDETIARLNASLSVGIAEGENLTKLKHRVEEVFDGVKGYRAERLARTETLKASNNASVWAYRQTGYVTGKEWVVNPGACPECEEFEGKNIPLDDSFLAVGESYTYEDEEGNEHTVTNDYDTVEEPPLHPNCRCTVIPTR